jgi:ubiquinol-cytochrome c reductase cytochrome c subunit
MLALALLAAAVSTVLPAAAPLAGAPVSVAPSRGQQIYLTHCASCHAAQFWGSADGPTLRGVGLGTVDFYLLSGRMPAAVPWIEVGTRDERDGQALPLADIRALEQYLAPVVAGGPPIPMVTANGDHVHGRTLFALNCQQCHSAQADGGSIGGLDWAPSLRNAPINVVADAIRVGPDQMPPFSEQQLSPQDLVDVASYVVSLQSDAARAPPLQSTGPVPEGAIGYLLIIVLVAFVFTFWRTDTPAQRREAAVRRDEGERRT